MRERSFDGTPTTVKRINHELVSTGRRIVLLQPCGGERTAES